MDSVSFRISLLILTSIFISFPAQSLLKLLLADAFLCKAIYFAFLSAAVVETSGESAAYWPQIIFLHDKKRPALRMPEDGPLRGKCRFPPIILSG